MDWLTDFIKNLPLETISDYLSQLVKWWGQLVADVPAEVLPLYAYVGCSFCVLVLWLFVARILPRPLGVISWVIVFAVLCTPTMSLGEPANIAPACIAFLYGILMKDTTLVLTSGMAMLLVMSLGFFVAFLWQRLKVNILKYQQKTATTVQTS